MYTLLDIIMPPDWAPQAPGKRQHVDIIDTASSQIDTTMQCQDNLTDTISSLRIVPMSGSSDIYDTPSKIAFAIGCVIVLILCGFFIYKYRVSNGQATM